jgi:hypothetical protein
MSGACGTQTKIGTTTILVGKSVVENLQDTGVDRIHLAKKRISFCDL